MNHTTCRACTKRVKYELGANRSSGDCWFGKCPYCNTGMVLILGFSLHEDGLAGGRLMYTALGIDDFGWKCIERKGKYFTILAEEDE